MHVMIDLETLGLTPKAVVTQIGYAFFNLEPSIGDRDIGDGIVDSGCLYLDPGQQMKNGREADWSTFAWWLRQDELARYKMADASYTGPRYALQKLDVLLAHFQIDGVWSNGPSFDQAILENLMREYDHMCPWKYNAGRDFRTMHMLCPTVERITPTIAHSAEADAIAQARFVQKCVAKLFPNGME